jgi:hypothetical protein
MITCEPSASVMVAPARWPWSGSRPRRPPCRRSQPRPRLAGTSRRAARGLREGWLRDRALGCGHYGGLFARQVGGERIVEFRGIDREFSGRLGAVPCRILESGPVPS